MSKAAVILRNARDRQAAHALVASAPDYSTVSFDAPRRSLPQNDRLWASLTDIARHVEWAGSKRTPEAWKDIFTAALRSAKHGLDVVPGINGGFVLLGMHTSAMTKGELSELLELIYAFGAERGVVFTDEKVDA